MVLVVVLIYCARSRELMLLNMVQRSVGGYAFPAELEGVFFLLVGTLVV
jgi:hypothetical protein